MKRAQTAEVFVKSNRFNHRARRDQSGLFSVHLRPDLKSEEKYHKGIWHGKVYQH
jgi:hypothetical protein